MYLLNGVLDVFVARAKHVKMNRALMYGAIGAQFKSPMPGIVLAATARSQQALQGPPAQVTNSSNQALTGASTGPGSSTASSGSAGQSGTGQKEAIAFAPPFRGLTYEHAVQLAERCNLKLNAKGERVGKVEHQSPEPGEPVLDGTVKLEWGKRAGAP